MGKINLVEIIKEFSQSNISTLELKYKKLELKLYKESKCNVMQVNNQENLKQKWIEAPIVGKINKIDILENAIIKKGDIVCIIEAMKTFNEIRADNDYKVIKVNVKKGEKIEYGQKLVLVEKLND